MKMLTSYFSSTLSKHRRIASLRIGSRAFQKRLQAASAKPHHSPCRKSGTFQNKKAATVSDSRRVGYTILLAVVLFLFAYNRSAGNNAAADEQQCDPQHEAACVAGRGRLRQLRRYGVGLGDFLGAILVTVILITAASVPILDIALGILGRRLCGDVF